MKAPNETKLDRPNPPYFIFDDDGILTVHGSIEELSNSIEETYLDEIDLAYDGTGKAILVSSDGHNGLTLRYAQSDAGRGLREEAVNFFAKWIDGPRVGLPRDTIALSKTLSEMVPSAQLRGAPR